MQAALRVLRAKMADMPSHQPEQPGLQRSGEIHGLLYDAQGRCEHYHSDRDVLANLCGICHRYYACYKCHAVLCDHPFAPIDRTHPAGLCCGVCGATFSYGEYAHSGAGASAQDSAAQGSAGEEFTPACPSCGAAMNPGCQLHAHLYYLPEDE